MGPIELALVLVAIAVALMLWRVLNPAPALQVGDCGILDRRLGTGWIHWDEIEGAYQPRGGHADVVRLRVHVSERLSRKLRGKWSPENPPQRVELLLDVAETNISAVDVLQAILEHARKTAPVPSTLRPTNRSVACR
jgi:hypothetical protein